MNLSTSTDTIPEVDVSDLANLSADVSIHHDAQDTPSLQGGLFQNSTHNEMLTHYNRVVIGCFKEFFQSVNINNLVEVLQALKELNFVLANRAPGLAAHYNMTLEPCQISAEEVPDLVMAHLHHATAYNPEQSIRGRPHSRGNQYHWYNRQSSPLPRYNQQAHMSDAHFHSHPNRNYNNTNYHNNSKHNSPHPTRHTHNTSNSQVNAINPQSPNVSELIGSLQSQILGLQMQALQQSTLNSIKIFDGSNKSKFTSWAQNVENATRLCNLDTLSIALSKLQGAPLKLASYLKSKETNSGKTLVWSSLKKHLTSNYLEILYDTHAINMYDSLQKGNDESTEAYLHRTPDILVHIRHTNDMSSITAIGTDHAKILRGLKDSMLHNKLAESKAKKWINMAQVLQDVANMAIDFERSHGYSLSAFKVQYISASNSRNSYRSSKPPTKTINITRQT